MSLAAAEKTLTILRDTPALANIAEYGRKMQTGMSRILNARGIAHSFAGHPSMGGLFFRAEPPKNYRDWKTSDYSFYDALAANLIDRGVLCEPDSREPWFISSMHDDRCLSDTLKAFEVAVDVTMEETKTGSQEKFWVSDAGGTRGQEGGSPQRRRRGGTEPTITSRSLATWRSLNPDIGVRRIAIEVTQRAWDRRPARGLTTA